MRTALTLVIFILVSAGSGLAQTASGPRNAPRPGVKSVQVPYSSLRPSATIKVGGTADWVLIGENAVWVASTTPFAVVRIDPATNRIVAAVPVPGEACSGLAFGFGSVWVPICGKRAELVRIDTDENKIAAVLPQAPSGPEGGIAVSDDSVWMMTDKSGTLIRIDPDHDTVRQKITIPPGSYNPIYSDGTLWITSVESNVLTAVDAATGRVLDSTSIGPKPRFLTSGGGSIWTLNQGDGTISRVDEKTRRVVATLTAGIPGPGGDIDYGEDSVWSTVFEVPLTRVDATTNVVVKQWVGQGGDSLRVGFGSLWITDYRKGLISRIPMDELKGR
jgi:virginiamycin B lyase